MKKIFKQSLIVLALTAFVFTGCKKEDPEPAKQTTPAATGVLVATVNGNPWQSDPSSVMTTFIGESVKSTDVRIEADTASIMGIRIKDKDTSAILMYFVLKPGRTGVYNLSGLEYSAIYLGGTDFEDVIVGGFGYTNSSTVEITKFDATNKKMSGKFNITMTANDPSLKNVTVSNGTFTDLSF